MQRKQRIFIGITSFVLVSCILLAFSSESRLALRRMIAEPGRIGMVAPSSRALYKRMIRQALPEDLGKEALIVELGPGTGVGTQLLLEQGILPEQILCVELDPGMQKCMAEKFPAVTTILGDATNLKAILGDKCGQVTAIISGIPLKNLSKKQATAIISACHAVLKPQGKIAQFTYGVSPSPAVLGLERKFGGFTLFNLPPAFVWVFTKTK